MVVGRVIITATVVVITVTIAIRKIVTKMTTIEVAGAVLLVNALLEVIGRNGTLSPSPPASLSLLPLLLLQSKTLLLTTDFTPTLYNFHNNLITYNKHTTIMSTLTKPLKGICIPTTRYCRSRNIITITSDDNCISRIICASTASAIKYMRQYAR